MTPEQGEDEVKHYHGHRERLRTRLREAGPMALADYELLELVLFRAIPQRDVKPLAKALLSQFGSFPDAIAAEPQRLAEVKGMGPGAITEFKVVEAAAQRFAKGVVKKRLPMGSWSEVVDYCRTSMAFENLDAFPIDRRSGRSFCRETGCGRFPSPERTATPPAPSSPPPATTSAGFSPGWRCFGAPSSWRSSRR